MRKSLLVLAIVAVVLGIGEVVSAQEATGGKAAPPLAGVWEGTASGAMAVQNVVVTVTDTGKVYYKGNTPWNPRMPQGEREGEVLKMSADELVFRYEAPLLIGPAVTAEVSLKLKDGKLVGTRKAPDGQVRYLTLTRTP